MKMKSWNVEVRVELRKRKSYKTISSRKSFQKRKEHLNTMKKNKERVNTDYFFGA